MDINSLLWTIIILLSIPFLLYISMILFYILIAIVAVIISIVERIVKGINKTLGG